MPEYHPVTHVVFDFDGLLVDTEPCFTEAFTRMLKPYGKEFTLEIKAKQMGMKQLEAVKLLLEEVGLTGKVDPKEFSDAHEAELEKLFTNVPAKEGAEKLVRHLAANNIPMAICTGSASHDFALKAKSHLSWVSLIPQVVLTGDDPEVKRGKPAPDGYLLAMKRFPQPPAAARNVLVFEDAPNGVKSALAAGMQCVQVPTAPHPAFRMGDEIDKQITVVDSLLDVDLTKFGLPAMK